MNERALWAPSPERIAASQIKHYMDWLAAEKSLHFADYQALWQWSVDQLEDFWESIWQYFDVRASAPYQGVDDRQHVLPVGDQMFAAAILGGAIRRSVSPSASAARSGWRRRVRSAASPPHRGAAPRSRPADPRRCCRGGQGVRTA